MKTIEEKFSDFHKKWMDQLEDHLRLLLVVSKQQCSKGMGKQECSEGMGKQECSEGMGKQECSEVASKQSCSEGTSKQQCSEGTSKQLICEAADCDSMYNKLTAHHKEYYTIKWASAREDVLAFYRPVWLTSLENAYMWMTGWKPSTTFRLVESLRRKANEGDGLTNLTDEQVKKIEVLRVKIKADEKKVEREMERQQVAIANRKMVELIHLETATKNKGEAAAISEVDKMAEAAVKGIARGLEKVMKMADCARLKMLKGILDVLTPMQRVDFLAATSMFLIQLRKWGNKRERGVYNDDNN